MPLKHETRRTIVSLLREGEMSAGALAEALERPRPGVSHHLSCLLDRDIVTVRTVGATRIYTLNFERALAAWNELLREHDSNERAGLRGSP